MEYLVTIITIYYNRQNQIRESIDSLLNQEFTDFQVVVVDDCSTDQTFKNLMEFYGENNRIKLIRNNTNIGFTNSLIQVIKTINSKYIAIHGSGDISLKNRISKQVNVLDNKNSVGFVGTASIKKDAYSSNIITRKKAVKGANYYTKKDFINFIPFSHGTVMFRKDIYNIVGGYRKEFKYCQDKDLWIRMSEHSESYRISEELYIQNIDKTSVSTSPNKAKQQYFYTSLAKYLGTINGHSQVELLLKINNGEISIDDVDMPKPLLLDRSLRLLQLKRFREAKKTIKEYCIYRAVILIIYIISLGGYLQSFNNLLCKIIQKVNSNAILKDQSYRNFNKYER